MVKPEDKDYIDYIDRLKKQVELSKMIAAEYEHAFLQRDVDKLVALERMRTGEMSKEEELLLRRIFDNLFGTHRPQLFDDYPTLKDNYLPQAISLGLASEIGNNWYIWQSDGSEYGAFVKKMASLLVGEDSLRRDSLLVHWQADSILKKDKPKLQFVPYREIFINAEQFEKSARAANNRDYDVPRLANKIG